MRSRTRRLAGGALLLAVTVSACSSPAAREPAGGGAGGVCPPPQIVVEPTRVAAGAEITVRGTAMMDGCGDAMDMDKDGNLLDVGPPDPLVAIEIVLVRDDRTEPLAIADADADGTFDVVARIPPDAAPGTARVSAKVRHAEPATVVIVD